MTAIMHSSIPTQNNQKKKKLSRLDPSVRNENVFT